MSNDKSALKQVVQELFNIVINEFGTRLKSLLIKEAIIDSQWSGSTERPELYGKPDQFKDEPK